MGNPNEKIIGTGGTVSKERQSNFELLRIIAMIMIIMYHYVIHGLQGTNADWGESNKLVLEIVSMFGKIGVNFFVLISGYFGIKSTGRASKLIKLDAQTVFFSVILFLATFIATDIVNFSVGNLLTSLFPVIFNQYWFITAYFVLYLFMPYINKMLLALTKIELKRLIYTILIIWCVVPTLTLQPATAFNWTQQIWMIAMYIVGAAIRLYPLDKSSRFWYISGALSYILLVGSVIVFQMIGKRVPVFADNATYFRWSNTLLAVFVTISTFMIFKNIKFPSNKVINYLAKGSIAVYLFHENQFFSKILWEDVLQCDLMVNSPTFVLLFHLLGSIILIYLIGIIFNQIFEQIYRSLQVVIEKLLIRYKE